jgi:hypothetical protein
MSETNDRQAGHEKWLYIESVMETDNGPRKCFDICIDVGGDSTHYVCEVIDEYEANEIVTACNNHKALLNELKKIVSCCSCGAYSSAGCFMCSEARALIKSVEAP